MTTIDALPNEILIFIFNLSVMKPSAFQEDTKERRYYVHVENVLRLAAVNRRFRAITLTTPAFWHRVAFDYPFQDRRQQRDYESGKRISFNMLPFPYLSDTVKTQAFAFMGLSNIHDVTADTIIMFLKTLPCLETLRLINVYDVDAGALILKLGALKKELKSKKLALRHFFFRNECSPSTEEAALLREILAEMSVMGDAFYMNPISYDDINVGELRRRDLDVEDDGVCGGFSFRRIIQWIYRHFCSSG